MKKLEKDSIVVIGKKDVKISEILPQVIKLPAQSILNYFTNLGLMFPRSLRMGSLKEATKPYVYNERPLKVPLSDEMRYRLRWFDTFSEEQLVNLLLVFEDGVLLQEYKEILWLSIIEYMLEKQVSNFNFEKLFDLAASLEKTPPLEVLDGKGFNNLINPLFFDNEDCIDGLTTEIFRPVVYKCSTLDEVRDIGKKYGVNVPRRLRKQELVDIIIAELKDRGELNPEVEEKVNGMTVIPLQRFAKNNDIKVSIELTKEEIIEYILRNAQQTRDKYFKPQADTYKIYDQTDFVIPDVKEVEIAPAVKVKVTLLADNIETTLEVVKGEKIEKPLDPTKTDHKFEGWYKDDVLFDFNQKVDEDLKLIAKFTPVGPEMVVVSFTAKGEKALVQVEKGSKVIKPENPVKEGFEFIGWFLEDNLYEFDAPVLEDLDLIAQWYELEPEMVTVTFVEEDGSLDVIINKGQLVEPLEVEPKEGYSFVGWHLDGKLFNFKENVTENIILVAKWEEVLEEPVVEKVYVSSQTESVDLTEAILEMRNITRLVEELKDAVNNLANPHDDKLNELDFSDKEGYEEKEVIIKDPVILTPYQARVTKRSFKKIRKGEKIKKRKVKKTKLEKMAVPVIVVKKSVYEE